MAQARDFGTFDFKIIDPVMAVKYGLEISSFIVENVSAPPEILFGMCGAKRMQADCN